MPRPKSDTPNRQLQIATTFDRKDYETVDAFANKHHWTFSKTLRILALRGLQSNGT